MPAPTVIPKETRRDAIVALYTHEDGQQADGRQAARRSVLAAALAKKIGCGPKYLLDTLRRLPKGLEYNDKSWTLRRAANAACKIEDDARPYTNHELMTAVLLTQDGGTHEKLTQVAARVRSPPTPAAVRRRSVTQSETLWVVPAPACRPATDSVRHFVPAKYFAIADQLV